MANEFATPTNVMRRVARRLVNNCVFAANVMRGYDAQYKLHGVKQGDTVTLRLPQRYEVTTGKVMNPTPLTDQTVNLTITDQSHIGFEYDSWHATLFVQDYMERYAAPAVDQLINHIDETGCDRMYKTVAKAVGTPGTVPASNQVYTDAVTKLHDTPVPQPFLAMLTPNMQGTISNQNTGLFNPAAQISQIFRKGQFSAMALGIDRWFMDQNLPTHTVGALGGTPAVAGAGQTGASITADGASNSVTGYFLEGDVIQFASVFEVNELSRKSTGELKDFVVTADVDSDGSGNLTIPISPSIITSGPFQNCSAAPANNDAITTFGHASNHAGVSTRQGFVYNKEAFACVMADLILPRGLWVAERISNSKLGISIRMLKDHQILEDESPARLDTAHGWSAIRQVLATRVSS